jgi:cytochrome P450
MSYNVSAVKGLAMSRATVGVADLRREFDELLGGASGDPGELYSDLRAAPPVFSDKFNGWVFTRHRDVHAVLSDEPTFPPLLHGPGTASIYGRTVLQMSGSEHARALAPVARALRATRNLDAEIADLVARVAGDYVGRLPLAPDAVDLRAEFFSPYPMAVISELMGIPAGAEFRRDYGTVVRAATSNVDGNPDIHSAGETARSRVFHFLEPHIQQRLLDAEGEDLLSELCGLVVSGTLDSIDAAKSYALFLFIAGVETTERTLTSLVATATQNPALWATLRDDRSLVTSAIVETLRMHPPVQAVSRGVAASTTVSGVNLDPGDRVLVVLGAANRDESVFRNSDEFDPRRFLGRESREFTPASEILTFGTGVHHCTGSRLARLEAEVALNLMLDRIVAVESVDGQIEDPRGYVLRAPASMTVRLSASLLD